ncbi:MAG: hypothetical protein ACRDL7_05910 [Gaiellaceae bacterium]
MARTPTSPAMSASSSLSQSASSPGSNEAAAASSPVSAWRDFERESRRREKKRPPLSSSGSGAASGSPSSSDQLRGELPFLFAAERLAHRAILRATVQRAVAWRGSSTG